MWRTALLRATTRLTVVRGMRWRRVLDAFHGRCEPEPLLADPLQECFVALPEVQLALLQLAELAPG